MCVSGQWLVVIFSKRFSTGTIRLYRLPDLARIDDLNYSTVYWPRCSSDRRVYVPALYMVTELEITELGNLTVIRNITLGIWDWITAVTPGPQAGQLCIGALNDSSGTPSLTAVLYIINIDSGRINVTLTVPYQNGCYPITVSALSTGQILLTSSEWSGKYDLAVLYQTLSHQPRTLRNSTFGVGMFIAVAYKENFLVADWLHSGIEVLDKQGRVTHTVEYGYGAVSTPNDLAVWQDNILVVNFNGDLLWLSHV